MNDQTELKDATVERIGTDITQVRFHAHAKLTNEMIAKVVRACRHTGKGTAKVIVVFPEHTDFNAQVMLQDQCVANGVTGELQALAIVCQEYGFLPMLHLYLAYFPPSYAVKFCDTVEDALRWLDASTKGYLAA